MKQRDVSRVGFVALLLNVFLCGSVQAQDARVIARKAFPSVVLLAFDDANGQPLTLGSGFFVRRDIIVTNMHVVEGASSGFAKVVGKEAKHKIVGIAGRDENSDLVLLKVNSSLAPPLALGSSDNVEVGEEVYVVGNPVGLEGTFSQGIISGIRRLGDDSLLQITAPISPGSSGGPVLNSQGQVIGVAVASFRSGQNLNFAIPASYLSRLLKQAEIVRVAPLGPASARKEKSFVASQGDPSIEGVVIKYFNWDGYNGGGFTVQNQLAQPVRKIDILVMFIAEDGGVVDSYRATCPRGDALWGNYPAVEPGMGKRCQFYISSEVRALTTKVEFRVLSFELAKR
jgi:S1-C subfamily serine protease